MTPEFLVVGFFFFFFQEQMILPLILRKQVFFPGRQMMRSSCSSLEDGGADEKNLPWRTRKEDGLWNTEQGRVCFLVVWLTSWLDQEFKVIISYRELEGGLPGVNETLPQKT